MTSPSNHHEQEPPANPDADLTAYALGELPSDSAEHAAVEARLADPGPSGDAARAELASIRATAADLTAALAQEPVPEEAKPDPSPTTSAVSPDGATPPPASVPIRHWPRRLAIAAGFAAAAALGVALVVPGVVERREAAQLQARFDQANALYNQGLLSKTEWESITDLADQPDAFDRAVARVENLSDDQWLATIEREAHDRSQPDKNSKLRGLFLSEANRSDNELRSLRNTEARALRDQPTPTFPAPPEFGLTDALSNTNSGGGGGSGGGGEGASLFGDDGEGTIDPSAVVLTDRNTGEAGARPDTSVRLEGGHLIPGPTPAPTPVPLNSTAPLALGGEPPPQTPGDWRGSVARNDNRRAFETDAAIARTRQATTKRNAEEVRELMQHARQLQKEMKYDDALLLLERARVIEPDNLTAQLLTEVVADSKAAADDPNNTRVRRLEATRITSANREAVVPFTELMTFPEDWPELSDRRIRGLNNDTRSEADREASLRLKRNIPIHFDANRLEDVVDYLQETTGSTLAVDWDSLREESGIERDHPISLQLQNVSAEHALTLVLQQAAASGFGEPVGYAVVNGVVVVSSGPKVERATPQEPRFVTESYNRVEDNPFLAALDNPLSTFSIDVDTASYANVRRFLEQGQLPPADAVRIEEMVNYFDYGYEPPLPAAGGGSGPGPDADALATAGEPFAAHVEVTAAPWSPQNRLVRIGIKGMEIATDDRPAANLVFLLDVSGSMNNPRKLPLVKAGMKKLVQALRMDDRVAIVVYAGASGLVLDSTSDHDAVLAAIDNLVPGGSTNGAAGIELAYQQAVQNHIPGGLNRVILCTDGDFNVGITDRGALTRLIEDKANTPETPTYLTVLGFGTGNLKDATMEELSNVGDGNYGYVDSLPEAEKLLAEQVNATLLTIAKDVKVQVEFNPAKVASYRLIGYENRLLAKEDFNNDVVDAGDIGAGHTVTALYEVVPAEREAQNTERANAEPVAGHDPGVDPLKYQRPAALSDAADSGELLTLKLRYKQPDAAKVQGTSKLLEFPVEDAGLTFAEASEDTQFAAAVAGFGMLLRGSPYAGDLDFEQVAAIARDSGEAWFDKLGPLTPEQQRRQAFVQLVGRAAAASVTRD